MATLDSQTCQLLNDDFDLDLEPEVYPPALPQTSALPYVGGDALRGRTDPAERPQRSPNLWDPRLCIDLALGLDALPEVLARYDLNEDAFERLAATPAFRRELSVATREVREQGLAFPKKCATQAEMYLERLDELVYDPGTPSSTILSIVQWLSKMGNLEPKESKGDSQSGATINVQINF